MNDDAGTLCQQARQQCTIQPDGRIVAGGSSCPDGYCSDFALARYAPDGSLDSSFGQDETSSSDSFMASSGSGSGARRGGRKTQTEIAEEALTLKETGKTA